MTPALEDLFSVLRFASISTDSQHAGDVRDCANWYVDKFQSMGLSVELHETAKHPIVVARNEVVEGRKTVMV